MSPTAIVGKGLHDVSPSAHREYPSQNRSSLKPSDVDKQFVGWAERGAYSRFRNAVARELGSLSKWHARCPGRRFDVYTMIETQAAFPNETNFQVLEVDSQNTSGCCGKGNLRREHSQMARWGKRPLGRLQDGSGGTDRIKSHEAILESDRPPSYKVAQQLPRSNTTMHLPKPLSKLKEKFKRLRTGRKRKSGGTGVESGGESDSMSSLPRSDLHAVASGGHSQEDAGAKIDGWQVRSTNQPPRSHGDESDQRGGEADVGEGGMSQIYSHPHSDAEAVVGGGPSRGGDDSDKEKIERAHPPPSTSLILVGGGPDGM